LCAAPEKSLLFSYDANGLAITSCAITHDHYYGGIIGGLMGGRFVYEKEN